MAILRVKELNSDTWYALPDPDYNGGYSCDIQDVDAGNSASERDQNGLMHRDRVAVKHTIDCQWSNIHADKITFISEHVSSIFFNLEYLDPQTNTRKTGVFYVGDRKANLYSTHNSVYSSFSLNFIEQ